MKHFILTSTKFTGQLEYKYDTLGYLIYFEYNATMTLEQQKYILQKMPLALANLRELVQGNSTVSIVEVPADISFEYFWKKYNNKVNRKRAEPLYNKLSDKTKLAVLDSIDPYLRYLFRTGYRGQKDPDGYLRDEMYKTDWNTAK
jgi:hypothetical protein